MNIEKEIRRDILRASYEARACHIGSALGCVELVLDIYTKMDMRDVFFFGKASGVVTFYSLLANLGKFPKSELAGYLKKYPLASKEVPGVVHSVGSLGHALPVAAGMAYADRTRNVHVLISDGEVQEGTTWETALFARQHKLDNLKVYVDANGLQACGATKDICELTTAYEFLNKTFPSIEIVQTLKGKGVDFCENDYTWHYRNLDADLLERALKQI